MTATATARPATAVGAPARPRLLLPPLAEQRSDPDPRDVVLIHPHTRSVLFAPTEEEWPVPAADRVRRAALPDAGRVAGSVVVAAVEVLVGTRPLVQLTRWVTPEVLEQLAARVPVTASTRRRRAHLVRVQPCPVSARATEVTVVVNDGERVRAAAVRLEVHRGHWRVSVLQIG